MSWFKLFLRLIPVVTLVAISTLLAACASKPQIDTNVTINFPPDEIVTSVDQADDILNVAKLARAQIDWRFRQKEQICYDKFFVNHCLLEAKDERRVDLARVKKSEVAANFFKRKQQVEDMDRNLVEKNVANPLPEPNPGPSQNDNGETESDADTPVLTPSKAK